MSTTGDREDGELRDAMTRRDVLRRGTGATIALGLSGGLLAACGSNNSGSQGTTGGGGASTTASHGIPTKAFDPSLPPGAKPNLPRRFGFALPSEAEFLQLTLEAMQQAGKDVNIEILSANASGSATTNVQQAQAFLTRGVAGLMIGPVDPAALVDTQRQAIEKGVLMTSTSGYVPPVSQVFTADQYAIGKQQGMGAANWIKTKLGGRANVAYLQYVTTIPGIKERSRGVIDALKTAGPGVNFVAKIQPKDESSQTGFQVMNTVLQAHPDIDVVLAADSVAVGALSAIQAAGKVKPNLYVSGVNGDAEALKKVEEGGSYRASIAAPFSLLGYLMVRYASDWLDGKSVPQVCYVNTFALTNKREIDAFNSETALSNLGTAFASIAKYVRRMGNISYATRQNYLNVVA